MNPRKEVLYKKCTYKAISFIVILGVIIFTITVHTYNNDYYIPSGTYIINWKLTNDISCHQKTKDDALNQLSDDFKPPAKSIFMHETSCRGGLNSRQACAVESAARAHPDWHVHMLFSGPVTKEILERSCLAKLQTYDNIKLLRIHLKDFAKGTPVQSFFETNPITKSTYKVEHTSDLMRYLTLYKYGGVYMDSDVVVIKPFDTLASDWSARESSYAVDAGLMAFSSGPLGRRVAEATIQNFQKNYDPNKWGNNGPGVITRVVKEMCSKNNNTNWIKGCDGFVIYDPVVFYPVYYPNNKLYFKPDFNLTTSNETYAHHMWNALTRNYDVPTTSPYAKLARQYCPKVYALYGDKFGV